MVHSNNYCTHYDNIADYLRNAKIRKKMIETLEKLKEAIENCDKNHEKEVKILMDLCEEAWNIISNNQGNWDSPLMSEEWIQAAVKWRDKWEEIHEKRLTKMCFPPENIVEKCVIDLSNMDKRGLICF